MPLIPQLKILIDVTGDVVWIQDSTGVYSVNNLGGWGNPNPERNEIAVMCYAKRIDVDGNDVISTFLTNQFFWDAAYANEEVSTYQIVHDEDGVYNLYLFTFPVTTDGINDLEGNPLTADRYVYYNAQLQFYDGSTFTPTSSGAYESCIDDANIPQVFCEDIIMPKLFLKYNAEYKAYVKKRNENCEDIDADPDRLMDFRFDLEGTEYAFRSNLQAQARTNLEALKNEYDS